MTESLMIAFYILCGSILTAIIWPVGQEVKTRPFHGCNASSILARVTSKPDEVIHPVFSML